jgi:DNA repair protein RadC
MGQDLFDKEAKETTSHTEYRQRLRASFLTTMDEGMPDYEWLELLLMLGIPCRDVKPLAKDLIDRFGGFSGVVSADIERLRNILGLGDTAVASI